MTDLSSSALPSKPARVSWYRRLYSKVESYSSTQYALVALLLVSVVDGSVFPVPPFALLVPMVLAQPNKWVRYCVLGTLASIVGGVIGYEIGTLIHSGAVSFLHIDLNVTVNRFGVHGTLGELLGQKFWVLALLCSILPTPLKIVAIASGMVSVPMERFLLALLIGRTVRFVLIGGLVRYAGPTALRWLGLRRTA